MISFQGFNENMLSYFFFFKLLSFCFWSFFSSFFFNVYLSGLHVASRACIDRKVQISSVFSRDFVGLNFVNSQSTPQNFITFCAYLVTFFFISYLVWFSYKGMIHCGETGITVGYRVVDLIFRDYNLSWNCVNF